MIVLKQISVQNTDMIITIFPVWSSIINALLGTQINVNICVVKPSKVHFIAVYSYMGLSSMIYSIVQYSQSQAWCLVLFSHLYFEFFTLKKISSWYQYALFSHVDLGYFCAL